MWLEGDCTNFHFPYSHPILLKFKTVENMWLSYWWSSNFSSVLGVRSKSRRPNFTKFRVDIGNSSSCKVASYFTYLALFRNEGCRNARRVENRSYFCMLTQFRHPRFDRSRLFIIFQSHSASYCQISRWPANVLQSFWWLSTLFICY